VHYALAADAVLVLHGLFILFAALGGLLVAWRRPIIWLHLPAVAWGAWIALSGGICPLTPLENRLRSLAGGPAYGGGFIEHYLLPVIYPAGLTPQAQIVLGGTLIAVNLAVYAWLLRRARR